MALAGAQAAGGFALATKASIQQAAALVATTAAQWSAVNADAAAARQSLETAKSRQADALALMERAKVEVVAAQQKIVADRMRQTSEINNLKSVQATLAAERTLEEQRLKAQISEQGRALALARMATARLDEVAIIKQIQAAEASLAATTAATSAEIQAAYAVRSAAVAAYGETTLAVNAAVRTSEAATVAASNASKAVLLTAAAGRGLLALLTGPVGLIAATALIAASFLSMSTRADEATQALSAHGATVDEVAEKYEKLNGAQQRVKRLEWIDEHRAALESAASALDEYSYKIERGINLGPQAKQFRTMIEEVERGQRTLDSVTTWIESQANLYPEFRKEIAQLTRDYDNNVQKADQLKTVLSGLDGETRKVAQGAEQMRGALAASQEQSKAQVAKWEEYIVKLRQTRDLFGANKKAQAEFEASKMGLNDKQREEARLVASQIDVMDKYKDAVKAGDKAKQQSLRKELEAIYARQQALADAAAAEKKLQDAANKAAEESANKKISEMQRVLEAANKVFNAAAGFSAKSSFLTGRNMLLASPEQQSITGRSMVLPGSPTPSVGVAPRKSPQQLAAERLAQIEATTDRNKTAGDKAANALKKRFETMEEGYKRQIELINTSTDKRKNATEVEKLAFELASGKLEGVNAKQRKVLEGLAAELDAKKALLKADQDAKKLAALKFNLAEDNRTTQDGFEQELAGAGRGEKYRAQLREKLSIEQDFNKQRREMYKEYKEAVLANDPDAEANYKKETQMLDEALAERLAIQQDYYDKKDEMQSNWLDGAKDAWQDYSDHARDLSSQMYDVTSNALSSLEDELVNFVKTGKFNFEEFAAGIAEDLLRMLVRIGLQMAVNAAIGNTAAAASSALAVATGTAMATAYAPAAALASLASFGANAAPASAALTTTTGLASSLALVGMAHDGIDSVPREGTWLLQKGERVTTAGTSAKLDKTLESIQSQGGDQGQWNTIAVSALGPLTRSGEASITVNIEGPAVPERCTVQTTIESITLLPRNVQHGLNGGTYEYFYSLDPQATAEQAEYLGQGLSLTHTGLAFFTNYYYFIRSRNAYGVSSFLRVPASTSTNVTTMLEALKDKIERSQLGPELGKEIDDLQDQIAALDGLKAYDPDQAYEQGQLVVVDGRIYQALHEVAADPEGLNTPPNNSLWADVGQTLETANGLVQQVQLITARIEEVDGRVTASADQLSLLQAAWRPDSAEGELADALAGWETKARIKVEEQVRASETEALARRAEALNVSIGDPVHKNDDGERQWGIRPVHLHTGDQGRILCRGRCLDQSQCKHVFTAGLVFAGPAAPAAAANRTVAGDDPVPGRRAI